MHSSDKPQNPVRTYCYQTEDLQVGQRRHANVQLAANRGVTPEVQEEELGGGLRHLLQCQIPQATLFSCVLEYPALPAAAFIAQVYVGWEGGGGVQQLSEVAQQKRGLVCRGCVAFELKLVIGTVPAAHEETRVMAEK